MNDTPSQTPLAARLAAWAETLGLEWTAVGVEDLSEAEKAAALLLLMVHKGFNSSVWGNKRLRYWGAFKDKLSLCLNAETLPQFASQFASEMSATIGRNQRQRQIVVEICWRREGREILDVIGREYEMLVALTQVLRDAIQAQYDEPDPEIVADELKNLTEVTP